MSTEKSPIKVIKNLISHKTAFDSNNSGTYPPLIDEKFLSKFVSHQNEQMNTEYINSSRKKDMLNPNKSISSIGKLAS